MLMQVFCMSFWHNAAATFRLLFDLDKSGGATFTVFQRLLNCIPGLSLDFELRRAIFGLTSIVNTEPHQMPGPVTERLPDIVQWIAQLCMQMHDIRDRQVRLKERENYTGPTNDEDFESDDSSLYESEDEFSEINNRILAMKEANAQRQAQQRQFDPAQQVEDDSSECDSDYDYLGGDAALYDSAIDGQDELLFVKESLGRLFEMGGPDM
jgi:hypothetical protein